MNVPTHRSWAIGSKLGTSSWLLIDQARIDGFARYTDDEEPLHNDEAWCTLHSPFKRPIAHGFLTLSMLTRFVADITNDALVGTRDRMEFPLNYGFEKIRFLTPVLSGRRIRAHVTLLERQPHKLGDLMRFDVSVEIEGHERPALVADWLSIWVSEPAAVG